MSTRAQRERRYAFMQEVEKARAEAERAKNEETPEEEPVMPEAEKPKRSRGTPAKRARKTTKK